MQKHLRTTLAVRGEGLHPDSIFGAPMRASADLPSSDLRFDLPLSPVSDVISNDPGALLSLQHESRRYSDFLSSDQPHISEDIRAIQNTLPESPNDANNLRCIVAIPVAGRQEYGNIFNTLEQFGDQSLDLTQYEIFLNINVPAETDKSTAADLGDSEYRLSLTLEEISRFQRQYPEVPLRCFIKYYEEDLLKIGRVRSDLWSVINEDLLRRQREKDILVVSGDADTGYLNRGFLEDMVRTSQEANTDIVTAGLKWQNATGLPYDAMVNRILRYQAYLSAVEDRYSTFLHTADVNTGLSLATYLAVGGYYRHADLGEMQGVARRIRKARSKSDKRYNPAVRVEAKSPGRLKSNPRRLVEAMALGKPPHRAWDRNLIDFTEVKLRTRPMQAEAAELKAQTSYQDWIGSMELHHLGDSDRLLLSPNKKDRMLQFAKRILSLYD